MAARAAWILNLDADLELAAGPRYAPTKAVRAAMNPHVERLAQVFVGPGDVLVDEASPPNVATGFIGRAFCPTPRAVSMLVRAGASPAPHPSVDVLRTVNSRAFCAALGPTLRGARFVRHLEEALSCLLVPPDAARQWRAKRAHGMAGRGQRPIAPGVVSVGDRAFLDAAISAEGGVMIEPDVAIQRELAIHGYVEGGVHSLGQLVEQTCDARGQWLTTAPAADVDPTIVSAIEDEGHRVARALADAGYFGPFGIDAFLYRDLAGVVCLQRRSEINARYSMGFAIGFGGLLPI